MCGALVNLLRTIFLTIYESCCIPYRLFLCTFPYCNTMELYVVAVCHLHILQIILSYYVSVLYDFVMCFSEHIAPVLSLTPALNNSVIVSGGEDSRIIITSLLTGEVVMKIDHHRGPVTSVKVNTAGDVLVSGPAAILVLLSFSFLKTSRLFNSVVLFCFLFFMAFPWFLLL